MGKNDFDFVLSIKSIWTLGFFKEAGICFENFSIVVPPRASTVYYKTTRAFRNAWLYLRRKRFEPPTPFVV